MPNRYKVEGWGNSGGYVFYVIDTLAPDSYGILRTFPTRERAEQFAAVLEWASADCVTD